MKITACHATFCCPHDAKFGAQPIQIFAGNPGASVACKIEFGSINRGVDFLNPGERSKGNPP